MLRLLLVLSTRRRQIALHPSHKFTPTDLPVNKKVIQLIASPGILGFMSSIFRLLPPENITSDAKLSPKTRT